MTRSNRPPASMARSTAWRSPCRRISRCPRAASTSAPAMTASSRSGGSISTSASPRGPLARANHIDRLVFAGGPGSEDRHHQHRQELSRPAAGARRARHRRGRGEPARPAAAQDRPGTVWPLDPRIVADSPPGSTLLIVVEEKRSLLETQLREAKPCNSPHPPVVIGKKDEAGNHLFRLSARSSRTRSRSPSANACSKIEPNPRLDERMAEIRAAWPACPMLRISPAASPFCAGCPHNSSTVVEGGRGYAGGATGWCSSFRRATPKGRPIWVGGANWIGEAPFSPAARLPENRRWHMDSGTLAIRAATRGVKITYKILYNDAVAMTGGQPVDTNLDAAIIARQVRGEGVTASPSCPTSGEISRRCRLPARRHLPPPRRHPGAPGADGRRRRTVLNTTRPAPPRSAAGASAAIVPIRTVASMRAGCLLPRVRRQVQLRRDPGGSRPRSAPGGCSTSRLCNKDYSCLKGFCPSFVTVEGGGAEWGAEASSSRRDRAPSGPAGAGAAAARAPLVDPRHRHPAEAARVGHILGMAAHLEGKGSGVVDMAGLSQKNGAVSDPSQAGPPAGGYCHHRIRARWHRSHPRLREITSASERVLATASRARTAAVVNSHQPPVHRGKSRFQDLRPTRWGCRSRRGPGRAPPLSSTPPRLRPRSIGNFDRRQSLHPRLRLAARLGAQKSG